MRRVLLLAALGAACSAKPRATAEPVAPAAPAPTDAAPIDVAPTNVASTPIDAAPPKRYTLRELMWLPTKPYTATVAGRTISIELPEVYRISSSDPLIFVAGDSLLPQFSLKPATGTPRADVAGATLTVTGELGDARWSLAIRQGTPTVETALELVNGTLSCRAYVETTDRTGVGAWMTERCLTAK